MTSEAIVIGVNQYQNLQPLEYAQQDAKAVAAFLKTEAKFDHVYYFAEDAEPINGVSMQPTQNNLRRILETRVAKRGLGDGDNFWFFFSGHGMRDGERDFLMPIDGYSENVALSGISTAQVSEWLRGCGADNVVMILDACRNGGRKDGKGIGDETREDCRQTGVISLFSCSPNQFSYELPQYQQGAFTKVLLEGLGVQGACATVARLDEYLKRRVPEVVRECLGNTVNQFPYSIAEPLNKSHLILMPQHSRPEDLNALKMDAFRAHVEGDVRAAYRCWLRVNIASRGMDMEAIEQIAKLYPQVSPGTIKIDPPIVRPTSEVLPPKGVIDNKIVDYSKLEQLLKNQQWLEADEETCNVMIDVLGGRGLVKNFKNYPWTSIEKIDRLWADASGKKFGFFAQARIWQQVNRDKTKFEIQVGWRLPNAAKAINQSKLKLNLEEAEVGHFPAFFKSWGGGGWSFTAYLLDRVSMFLDSDNSKSEPETKSQEFMRPIVPRVDPIPLTLLKRGDRKSEDFQPFSEDLENSVFIEMVPIPGGTFMGAKIEPFFMSKTLVTQAQWEAVTKSKKFNQVKIDLPANPSRFKKYPKCPVERVDWWQAEEFCARLAIGTPHDYRLPSEAQWEYACRSGTTTKFYFGNQLTKEVANYDSSETTDVASYPANAWGLYDLHGNVWEWCADHWCDKLETPLKDSNPYLSSNSKADRVLRGGSWVNNVPSRCGSAYRNASSPSDGGFSGFGNVGVRLVCSRSKAIEIASTQTKSAVAD